MLLTVVAPRQAARGCFTEANATVLLKGRALIFIIEKRYSIMSVASPRGLRRRIGDAGAAAVGIRLRNNIDSTPSTAPWAWAQTDVAIFAVVKLGRLGATKPKNAVTRQHRYNMLPKQCVSPCTAFNKLNPSHQTMQIRVRTINKQRQVRSQSCQTARRRTSPAFDILSLMRRENSVTESCNTTVELSNARQELRSTVVVLKIRIHEEQQRRKKRTVDSQDKLGQSNVEYSPPHVTNHFTPRERHIPGIL